MIYLKLFIDYSCLINSVLLCVCTVALFISQRHLLTEVVPKLILVPHHDHVLQIDTYVTDVNTSVLVSVIFKLNLWCYRPIICKWLDSHCPRLCNIAVISKPCDFEDCDLTLLQERFP